MTIITSPSCAVSQDGGQGGNKRGELPPSSSLIHVVSGGRSARRKATGDLSPSHSFSMLPPPPLPSSITMMIVTIVVTIIVPSSPSSPSPLLPFPPSLSSLPPS